MSEQLRSRGPFAPKASVSESQCLENDIGDPETSKPSNTNILIRCTSKDGKMRSSFWPTPEIHRVFSSAPGVTAVPSCYIRPFIRRRQLLAHVHLDLVKIQAGQRDCLPGITTDHASRH